MAKVTWLGEGDAGPEETQAFGKTFKLGEPVEITDEEALKSATGNQFFDVKGAKDQPETIEDNPELLPVSGQPAALGDVVKNAAFGSQEELDNHRQMSIQAAERNDEIQQQTEKRGRGRPRGSKNASSGSSKSSRKASKASKRGRKGKDEYDYDSEHVPST
jgi:hypothetical protein